MKRSAEIHFVPRRLLPVLLLFLSVLLLSAGCAPSTPEECLRRGTLRLREGKLAAARKLALRAERLAPADPSVLLFKAIVCERMGERDPALDAALRAVTANPDNFIARYTLGRLFAQDPARGADASRELRQALRLKPGDPDTLILFCNVMMAMNAPSSLAYLRMLAATPFGANSAAVQNQIGILLCRRRDYDGAKRAFLNAVRLGGREPVVWLNLARFFDYHTNASAAAEKFYREFIRQCDGRSDLAPLREAASARLSALERRSGR